MPTADRRPPTARLRAPIAEPEVPSAERRAPSAEFTFAEVRDDDTRTELATGTATRACWMTVKVRHGQHRRVSKFWMAVHLGKDGVPDVTIQVPQDLSGMRVHVHHGGGCIRCVEHEEG